MILVSYRELCSYGKEFLRSIYHDDGIYVRDYLCPVCDVPLFALTDAEFGEGPVLRCLDCHHEEVGHV